MFVYSLPDPQPRLAIVAGHIIVHERASGRLIESDQRPEIHYDFIN